MSEKTLTFEERLTAVEDALKTTIDAQLELLQLMTRVLRFKEKLEKHFDA